MAALIIKVPDPEKGSFNHKRSAGKLLQAQVLHLREALRRHLKDIEALLAIDAHDLKSEGEVSTYIQKATAILHTHSGKPSDRPVK
jgi:hypothetical protein